MAAPAEDNLAVAVPAESPDKLAAELVQVAARRLAEVEVVQADLPVADILDNTEAANSSKAEVEADTVDVCLEVHATCNSRNLLPTTIHRHPGPKPIGSIDSSIARRRLLSASS